MANGFWADREEEPDHVMADLLTRPRTDWEDDGALEDEEARDASGGWATETVLDLRDTVGPGPAWLQRNGSNRSGTAGAPEVGSPVFDLDHMLQAVLLQEGVLEDQEPVVELGVTVAAAPGTTLREMRRIGALGALSEDAQQTLLGGTLYEYCDRTGRPTSPEGVARLAQTMPLLSLQGAQGGSAEPSRRSTNREDGNASLPSLDRLLELNSRGGGGGGLFLERLLDTARSRRPGSSRLGTNRGDSVRWEHRHFGGAEVGASPLQQPSVASGNQPSAPSSLGPDSARTMEASTVRTVSVRSTGSMNSARAAEAEEASSAGTLGGTLRSSERLRLGTPLGSGAGPLDAEASARDDRPGDAALDRGPALDVGSALLPGSDIDDVSDGSLDETQSLWGLGDTARSAASSQSAGQRARWREEQGGGSSTLNDTNMSLDMGLDAGLNTMLQRLALDSVGLDESLARSVRRVLQLGTVLTGQRLSDDEITNLPKVRFENAEQQHCAICLEAYQKGELLTALRCSHFFHVECLGAWFRRATQCPLCRADAAEVS